MSLKYRLTRVVSLFLILIGLYQLLLTTYLLVSVYPQLISKDQSQPNLWLQQGLIEKMLVYYLSMVANGICGFFLLFTPKEKIIIFYLAFGILLSIFSTLFVIKTPLTSNPIFDFFKNLL